jgi:hypothetical protein
MTERTTTCPICGKGTLADIAYNEGKSSSDDLQQQPTSRQVDVYTCGHQVEGARLETADERLDVERRTSEETTETPSEDTPEQRRGSGHIVRKVDGVGQS